MVRKKKPDGSATNAPLSKDLIAIAPLVSMTLIPALQECHYPGNAVVLTHMASALDHASVITLDRKIRGAADRESKSLESITAHHPISVCVG